MSNTTEVVKAEIAAIQDEYEAAIRERAAAVSSINKTLSHWIQCGKMLLDLQTHHKGEFLGWMRDNLPAIEKDLALDMMRSARTAEGRECQNIDGQQLRLLGILPTEERQATPRSTDDGSRFVGWIGRANAWLSERLTERPLTKWRDDEKQSVVAQLEPLVKLYNQLTA